MKEQQQSNKQAKSRPAAQKRQPDPHPWLYKGKPLKVLTTSLGLVLAANLLVMSDAHGEAATSNKTDASNGPKLVAYSTEQVKKYYDPNVDWNIPLAPKDSGQNQNSGGGSTDGSGGNTTVIVNNGGYYGNGFGWSDLLLYHMIFNQGRVYSTRSWDSRHNVYDVSTHQPYKPKSYSSNTFQNKPTVGSTVRPKTSNTRGSYKTRSSSKSRSSSRGSIGGRSSGFSSSGRSSGGFFGG